MLHPNSTTTFPCLLKHSQALADAARSFAAFTSARPPHSNHQYHDACVVLFVLASFIRRTMVNIMASPATREPPGAICHTGKEFQFDTTAAENSLVAASGGIGLPMDPSTCIFWCAVALGALVKGSPVLVVRTSIILQNNLGPPFPNALSPSLSCVVRPPTPAASLSAPLQAIEYLKI